MKHMVQRYHLLVPGGVRIEERPSQCDDLVLGPAKGGETRDRYLHELADLEQLHRADSRTRAQQRDAGLDRFRDLVGSGMDDEATAGDAPRGHDEVLAREKAECLAHRTAA